MVSKYDLAEEPMKESNWQKNRLKWRYILEKIYGIFQWRENSSAPKTPGLLENLEQAHKEWKQANLYFNSVTDPDLIDHAIFYMGATEKKYVYLLKRARETGINIETPFLKIG
jgi:hypothetical protein